MKNLVATGILVLIIFLSSIALSSFGQMTPFDKGVNLTGWFQVGSASQIQFTKYTREDFEQIKSLGCDVIRLPINLHFMTNGAPNYTLDPLFLTFLDQVVDWTEDLNLHLIIDNHTFDSATDTDPKVGTILLKIWPQMASHFKNRSNLIYYEILNEPHGISDALWNSIQQDVIDAIRKVDTKHTIVIGPAGWNSYNNLGAMPVYTDKNLIYTFHFYDPFIFTHQGASWTGMQDLGGVPFPYSAENMPEFPASLRGNWVEDAFIDYKNTGVIAEVYRLIDIAVKFQQQRNVPIFCGELGVFDAVSPPADRVYWYNMVRNYLEKKNIGWTIWDYHGSFGLFEKNSDGLFNHDLNVPMIKALGLIAPKQTPYILLPDSVGFSVFTDFSGENIDNNSNVDGTLNVYSSDLPNNGKYCIQWSGSSQYKSIPFNFIPNRDLSYLAENEYAVDLFVRGNDKNSSFDLRFVDTKTNDTADHPWRNRIVIDNKRVDWNGNWEHLYLPLTDFTEHGSWDNAWFNPEGKFDWKAIDRLEIVSEGRAMGTGTIWIDNIIITNLDTALVNSTNGINQFSSEEPNFATLKYSPSTKTISISKLTESLINLRIVDLNGRIRNQSEINGDLQIDLSTLKSGTYFVTLYEKGKRMINRRIFIF